MASLAVTPARAQDIIAIHVDPGRRLRRIPADFIGLSFETAAVATPDLLSGDNRLFCNLARNLGMPGILRIGGITSDFAAYQADGAAGLFPNGVIFNAGNLRQLRTFLDAVDWKLIWNLNLADHDLHPDVVAAQAVADAMGDRLLAFTIGNEPDNFDLAGHREGGGDGSGAYGYDQWYREYRGYKAAIRASRPGAPFAGPNIANPSSTSWMRAFARDEKQDAVLLTAHHFVTDRSRPESTMEFLLQEEKAYHPVLARYEAISSVAGLPYRISSAAGIAGGGKSGVSDVFASALWALDFLFVLLSYGCSGVNMHGGVNHLGWISHYSPIQDDMKGGYSASPRYYGLLAFAQAAKGEQVAVTSDAVGINLTCYATRQDDGACTLVVINKDLELDASVAITSASALSRAHVTRLAAPAPEATEGVTLGGSAVPADGIWHGGQADPIGIAQDKVLLTIPAGSAALVALTA